MNNKFLIFSILVLIVLNLAFYGKTKGYEFVRLDDPVYVSDNPNIKDFNAEKLKKIFTEFYTFNYQPLVHLTYALEYKLFKNNASGYHITNTILHTLNSLLVFGLIYLIIKNGYIALIVALLFSLHPVQVESVAWVSERKGLLCAFFYFLSFISYIYYSRGEKKKLYFVSIFLFLAALLSKPMAITFPVILIMFDYMERKITKKSLIEKVPFFVLSSVFVVVTFLAQKTGGAVDTGKAKHVLDLIFFVFYNIGFYIVKLIAPINLSMHYGYPERIEIISTEIALSILVIAALITYIKYFKRFNRTVNFGIVFFLVSMLPILRFVPIGNTLAADRYMYMPMIGFFFALTVLLDSIGLTKRVPKNILIVIVVIYISTLSVLTHFQLRTWKDSRVLYLNALKVEPYYTKAYMGLGYYYFEKNDNEKARENISRALKDKYSREQALFYMGVSYVYDNNPDKAKPYFLELVNEYPENKRRNNTYAYRFLGDVSAHYNNFDEAEGYYKKSLELDLNNFQAHYGYGTVLEKTGKLDEAIRHYSIANRLNSDWNLPREALKRLQLK